MKFAAFALLSLLGSASAGAGRPQLSVRIFIKIFERYLSLIIHLFISD